MDSWEKFNETSLPKKQIIYQFSNGKYHKFRLAASKKSLEKFWDSTFRWLSRSACQEWYFVTSWWFENFRSRCLEIYELDPVCFLLVPVFSWHKCLKETKVELELLAGIDMLLMVEKGIRGGMCHAVHIFGEANNKYMKDYNSNKESWYLKYWNLNSFYGSAMLHKVLTKFSKEKWWIQLLWNFHTTLWWR